MKIQEADIQTEVKTLPYPFDGDKYIQMWKAVLFKFDPFGMMLLLCTIFNTIYLRRDEKQTFKERWSIDAAPGSPVAVCINIRNLLWCVSQNNIVQFVGHGTLMTASYPVTLIELWTT